MKNFKILFFFFFLVSMSVAVVSCDSGETKAKTEQQGKEYTSAYICPMHCDGSGSDKAGTCPVCKMDYVANKEHESHKHSGHNHDGHNHEGHSH